jgi:hypothetical protein
VFDKSAMLHLRKEFVVSTGKEYGYSNEVELHIGCKMALEISPLQMCMVLVMMMMIHKKSKSSVL